MLKSLSHIGGMLHRVKSQRQVETSHSFRKFRSKVTLFITIIFILGSMNNSFHNVDAI